MYKSNDTTSKVKTLADELYSAFQNDKRNDGTEFVHLKDGSPEWMTQVIHTAHGDKFPDDTVYEFVYRAAMALADAGDYLQDAISEIEPDIYTHDLTAWLHARVDHIEYIDQAISEFGQFDSGFNLLSAAQKMQIDEISYSVLSSLESLADDAIEEEYQADEEEESHGFDWDNYPPIQSRFYFDQLWKGRDYLLADVHNNDLVLADLDYWFWLDTNTYSAE